MSNARSFLAAPHELEWERAARGADGRRCPWGDHIDPTWACVLDSHPGTPGRGPVGSFPTDVSPYGVRGLAGNVRDWCLNPWTRTGPSLEEGRLVVKEPGEVDPDELRSIRGGAWLGSATYCRAASRFADKPGRSYNSVGLRLVRRVQG